MQTYSGWAVAGAWLLIENRPIKINVLTACVHKYGISGLGKRHGQTTTATLGAELRKEHGIFNSRHRGEYELWNPGTAMQNTKIYYAVLNITHQIIEEYGDVVRRLAGRMQKLEENESRLEQLEKWLHRIARLNASLAVASV